MDARVVNSLIAALSTILPQLGFKNVVRGKVLVKSKFIDSLGVTINVGLANQISGNVIFNMTEESAKGFSSVMMMSGSTELGQVDDLVQSATCEMVNMIISNAANVLSQNGITVKLAPPAFCKTTSQVKVCDSDFIDIEMAADELLFEIGIGVNN